MKVLLCLCACIAASSAGIIGYPVAPLGYQGNYVISHPIAPIVRPLGVAYTGLHGYPVPIAPSYFSYNVIPGSVVVPGAPGVFHYLPVAPPMGGGKPDKKKPDDKKDDKDSKEETTEEPKKEEGGESKTEDLAQ